MNINSVSNRELTLLRKLNQKKYRQREQLFLIEGARAVQQVIENGTLGIQQLFFDESQTYLQQEQWARLAEKIPSALVAKEEFAEVTDTDNPQGVMAVCEIPEEAVPEKLAQQSGIILATDAIQDPGNLGTIIRSASWFGVKALLSGKGTVDLFHPKVVRGTAGATGTVPHVNVELGEMLAYFEERGWSVVLLDAGAGAVPFQQIREREKMLLVIGNEANGINPSFFKEHRHKACIPSPREGGNVESLNAAIATSMALYAFN